MIEYKDEIRRGVVACDVCNRQAVYTCVDTWRDLIDALKEDGWSICKQKKGWKHVCLECMKRFMGSRKERVLE